MASMTRAITIGRAARGSGLSPKAIRLYETRGLLDPAVRTESGYRTYSERDMEVLRFIRQAKTLGLRLDEVRDIIDLQRQGAQPCGKVLDIVEGHIREIDRTMADLRALRKALGRARESAKTSSALGADAVVCRIIESQPAVPA
jgi:DNA-binding transcriptional MerR regulator